MSYARIVHPGFWFGKTSFEETLWLAKRGVGGFCLYGGTKQEVAAFTKAVNEVSPHGELLISADYEDGLGRWLSDAPLLPSNMAIGATNNIKLAYEKGYLTAIQAKSLGVNWVFAPVLDLANNPLNPIVNTRSFGKKPEHIIPLAKAFMEGLKKGGVLNSIKHFPGHGDTTTDSHVALPVINKTKNEILSKELAPFDVLLPLADSVMIGHLHIPCLDANKPASLSKEVITNLLRKQLHYSGCVVTDALLMKAIGDEKQAALDALDAGADILLVPENPTELINFLEMKPNLKNVVEKSTKLQHSLWAQTQQTKPLSIEDAFAPTDFIQETAKQAIALLGKLPTFNKEEPIYYKEIGNDDNLQAVPFLQTLEKQGFCIKKYTDEKVKNLLLLSFRRYQAFKGKIALDTNEIDQIKNSVSQAQNTTLISFASPWVIRDISTVTNALFTFSPSPIFQKTAAEILIGKYPAKGKLPIDL